MCANDPARQSGSALVLAMLVSVILTLLGMSFLFMADTENRIAENERLSAQALYAAEAGARAVKRWFDRPGAAIGFPQPTQVVRDRDSLEQYKATTDELFERPYRGTPEDSLIGDEARPDVVIEDSTFLDGLAQTLFGDFPAAGAGIVVRFPRIDVYGPPLIDKAGGPTRYGIATIKVVAQIVRNPGLSAEQVISERTVRAVLNESPYPGPYGPLHACGDLQFAPELTAYWGAVTAQGDVAVSSTLDDYRSGLPRSLLTAPRSDPFWTTDFSAELSEFQSVAGNTVLAGADPWFRVIASGTIEGLPSSETQPVTPWAAWAGGATPAGPVVDHSNLLQGLYVGCPEYDYDVWRGIAASGWADVRYYTWVDTDRFLENGRGTPRSFREITDGQEGVFFFDTKDGREPEDLNGDGVLDDGDNLTPPITISGGDWSFRGFLFLNTTLFQTVSVSGSTTTMQPPGEPFQDVNNDGLHADGEPWLDLNWPGVLGEPFVVTEPTADPTSRDSRGPDLTTSASMSGILFTSGRFEATGAAVYYGSVVARQGVVQTGSDTGRPAIYWDASLSDDWPTSGTNLPRVIVTRWITDL